VILRQCLSYLPGDGAKPGATYYLPFIDPKPHNLCNTQMQVNIPRYGMTSKERGPSVNLAREVWKVSEMPEIAYEVFDHTADIGLRAFGKTLPELFEHAAQGMESLMVPPEQVRVRESRDISVEGRDPVSLLINWLNALVFLFDTDYLLFR